MTTWLPFEAMRALDDPPKATAPEAGCSQFFPSGLVQTAQLAVPDAGTSKARIWPLTIAQLPPEVLRPVGCQLTPVEDHHHELGGVVFADAVAATFADGDAERAADAAGVGVAEAEGATPDPLVIATSPLPMLKI